jgi:hypothetical protein
MALYGLTRLRVRLNHVYRLNRSVGSVFLSNMHPMKHQYIKISLASQFAVELRIYHISCGKITNFMKHSPSWDADQHSDSQEISRVLSKLKVHKRIHNSQPVVPILSHSNPVHTPSRFVNTVFILILPSPLRLSPPSGLFPSGFPTKTVYVPLLSPIHATRPEHPFSWLDHPNNIT